MRRINPVLATSAIAIAICSGSAKAQDVSTGTPPSATEVYSNDIIVTANKREQKLNDVGTTVAVVGGAELKSRQINNLQDLAQSIPSLSYSQAASGTPVYTLRGVGFNDSSVGAYPTVSVYLDEAPLPFSAFTRHSAFDLERVEVLKGPQGTLFGQNSTGGAINYVAAKPTSTLKAGVNLTYGRFNQVIGEAYVSGPLSDTLRARVAGRVELMDGWQKSNSRPDDRNGKQRNYMGRILVDFTPTDTVRFALNVNGWKDRSEPIALQYSGYVAQQPIQEAGVLATPFSPESPRAADWTLDLPRANIRMLQGSLRGDIDLSDTVTFTTLTSYIDYDQLLNIDGDGLARSVLDLSDDDAKSTSFFQEARLSNGASSSSRWVLGANFEKSKVDQATSVDFRNSSSNPTLQAFFGYPIRGARYSSAQRMRSYAAFANAEFDLGTHFTVKGGARYTNSRSRQTACNTNLGNFPNDTGPFVYDILLGGAFGTFKAGDCFLINNQGRQIGNVPAGAPGAFTGSRTEDNVSWKVGLDYKPQPGILLYANVGRGYKAGGFPHISGTYYTPYLFVRQESVLAYEAGFKTTLLDRTLQLNGAAFYYDYSDKQVRTKARVPPFGILDTLLNVPKSTIKGFELEATLRPTRGFTVSTAFTYTDAKIKKFIGIDLDGRDADFSGTRIPFTPKYQIAVNADYEFPVSGQLSAFAGAGINLRSDTISVVGGDTNPIGILPTGLGATPKDRKLYGIDDYTLVDVRAGIKGPDDSWRVTLFGKNIFNTYYWNNAAGAVQTITRTPGTPATYGVSFSYNY